MCVHVKLRRTVSEYAALRLLRHTVYTMSQQEAQLSPRDRAMRRVS